MPARFFLCKFFIGFCILLSIGLFSCSESSNTGPGIAGELFIKIHDMPAQLQQVNISVTLVSIHRTGDNTNLGWSIVNANTVNVDLLSLRNGISEPLVLNKVNTGNYDQIRLRFGVCTVVENGIEYPLILNTAPTLDYAFNYNFDISEGKQTQLSFDFNVFGSVTKSGFSYTLQPDIRIENTELCGWISGSVIDTINGTKSSIPSNIFTSTGIDSISTQNELSTGSFQLSDLPENYYSIMISPLDSITFKSKRIDSLAVIRQKGTNVGVVVLERR